MKKTLILLLLYLCGMVCMAQKSKPYFTLISPISQSHKTLYREFKNPFWVVNPPCDSIKLECIKGQAKVWLDEYGSWIIVPDKVTENVWIGVICQNNFIDTIKYKTRDFGCNDLSLRFKDDYFPLVKHIRCDPPVNFLSHKYHWISSKFCKKKLKEYKKTHKYQGKLTLKEELDIYYNRELLLEQYFPQDLSFRIDTCTITLYGKYDKRIGKKPIKYQRHYTTEKFELDLEIIIEKMQKGDLLNISIPNILRLNYTGQRKPITLNSNSEMDDGWGDNPFGIEEPKTIIKCLEINFEIK
jgi:hypothetical protein